MSETPVVQICKRCRHWECNGTALDGLEWGDCQAVYGPSRKAEVWSAVSSDSPDTSVEEIDIECGLGTCENFGCNQWEAEEESEETGLHNASL